jgi:hypothetical protein
MINLNIYKSLILSITIQLITGIIEIIALFIKVPSKFLFLQQMLLLEVIVQVIEGSFYMYWFYNFKTILNVTPKRYLDWAITTPTMLLTLIFYLIFLKYKESNISYNLNFFDLFNQEFYTIIKIFILNWLMLLFGYLGEINLMPILLGVVLGFIPFLIYYYIIYKKYALSSNDDGLNIFFYFFIIWSLYGIVAVLPYKIKNMCYNMLDIFSKNFFGIFLSYLLFTNV